MSDDVPDSERVAASMQARPAGSPPDGRPARPGPGRPSKYTPERVARIETALKDGNTRSAAAAFGGITVATLESWERQFFDFYNLVQAAEAQAEIMYVTAIAIAARGDPEKDVRPDWRAAAYWLERRRHQDWGRKDRLDIIDMVRKMIQADGDWEPTEADEAIRFVEAGLRRGSRG